MFAPYKLGEKIGTNDNKIVNAYKKIAANTANIVVNTGDIASIESDITDIESRIASILTTAVFQTDKSTKYSYVTSETTAPTELPSLLLHCDAIKYDKLISMNFTGAAATDTNFETTMIQGFAGAINTAIGTYTFFFGGSTGTTIPTSTTIGEVYLPSYFTASDVYFEYLDGTVKTGTAIIEYYTTGIVLIKLPPITAAVTIYLRPFNITYIGVEPV